MGKFMEKRLRQQVDMKMNRNHRRGDGPRAAWLMYCRGGRELPRAEDSARRTRQARPPSPTRRSRIKEPGAFPGQGPPLARTQPAPFRHRAWVARLPPAARRARYALKLLVEWR